MKNFFRLLILLPCLVFPSILQGMSEGTPQSVAGRFVRFTVHLSNGLSPNILCEEGGTALIIDDATNLTYKITPFIKDPNNKHVAFVIGKSFVSTENEIIDKVIDVVVEGVDTAVDVNRTNLPFTIEIKDVIYLNKSTSQESTISNDSILLDLIPCCVSCNGTTVCACAVENCPCGSCCRIICCPQFPPPC